MENYNNIYQLSYVIVWEHVIGETIEYIYLERKETNVKR